MFKKSLIAVAALSALAGSAMAADVQIYGRIDTGFRYSEVDYDKAGVNDKTSFEMVSRRHQGFGRPRQRHDGWFRSRKRF